MSVKFLLSIPVLLFCSIAMANDSPTKIIIFDDGKIVTTLTVPASVRIDASAVRQTAEANKLNLKGSAKISLSFVSGEVMEIEAEDMTVVGRTKAEK